MARWMAYSSVLLRPSVLSRIVSYCTSFFCHISECIHGGADVQLPFPVCSTNLMPVPQGSVLGPLLFLLYINDLLLHTSLRICLFADDCILRHTFYQSTLNNSFPHFCNGSKSWQTNINYAIYPMFMPQLF